MAAFSKIQAMMPSFSAAEKKLAHYILAHPESIRELSSQGLALKTNVSQSSVVKFAQKLKFKGYPALKLAVLYDAQEKQKMQTPLHGSIAVDDDIHQVADKLMQSKINVLEQTRRLNEAESIIAAVHAIDNAKRVLISGIGGSALVGKDFTFKLQKLGLSAIFEFDAHAQLAFASTLTKKDVVFAISESGTTAEVQAVVQQAKLNQATVISLTKFGHNAIVSMSDIKLYSVAEESATRISSILARTAQELVIDMVFIILMQVSPARRHLLERSREVVSKFRRNGR